MLRFDEAWYAYANFHEFYQRYHRISLGASRTFAARDHRDPVDPQTARGLLASLDDHIQHAETNRLDITRFNEAFMMHTSTSPQYGIIASCDVMPR